MGEMGEYWRDVKKHYRQKQKKYEDKVSGIYYALRDNPLCKEVGNNHRIETWDFWYTGTVRNYKTGEYITLKQLLDRYPA